MITETNRDYGKLINDLTSGHWVYPKTGKLIKLEINSIAIRDTLDKFEGELLKQIYPKNPKTGIVCDPFTYDAAGERILRNVKAEGLNASEIIWQNPRSTEEGVEELRNLTEDYEVIIAVGSGTINDSVKYASFLDKKHYSVFPTSPQNAYTTPTASISFGGFKRSLTTHSPGGVFFDLGIISRCPQRLVKSAFADVICRTTAQVDWLTSHLLFNTPYSEIPYYLLSFDEDDLFANASKLQTMDQEIFGALIRICAVMGLGTSFTGTTNCGSMGEHMMSHYIDMFAGADHPQTLHGEQVGVCSLTISELQNQIIHSKNPPVFKPSEINEKEIIAKYGKDIGRNCIEQLKNKAVSPEAAEKINRMWEDNWESFIEPVKAVTLPTRILRKAMQDAGAMMTYADLGLNWEFYKDLILHSRDIRDRFTYLDVAHNAGLLESFADSCQVR